jgi:hypothetical protein
MWLVLYQSWQLVQLALDEYAKTFGAHAAIATNAVIHIPKIVVLCIFPPIVIFFKPGMALLENMSRLISAHDIHPNEYLKPHKTGIA